MDININVLKRQKEKKGKERTINIVLKVNWED